jgi:alpha-beta hydrolase superfamily lysophospholipase
METTITEYRSGSTPKWVSPLVRSLGVASGGAISASLALAYYVTRRITAPTQVTPFDAYTFTPFEVGVPYEAVTFPSANGTALRGWWMYRADSQRVVITCGGYRGHRADMLGIAAALWRDGSNVLIFDYRGHGELAGTPVTLGYQEVQDLLSAVDYVKSRLPDATIGVIGYSMGGSVAIMGAARCQDIRAVVADSPFALQREVVRFTMNRVLRLPHGLLLHLVDILLGYVVGYHFRDVEPLREVGLIAPRPLLLIHGENDTVTNPRDSRALYDAAGAPKELWVTPGVEHCGTYFVDRASYCARITTFFRQALDRPALEAESDGKCEALVANEAACRAVRGC